VLRYVWIRKQAEACSLQLLGKLLKNFYKTKCGGKSASSLLRARVCDCVDVKNRK